MQKSVLVGILAGLVASQAGSAYGQTAFIGKKASVASTNASVNTVLPACPTTVTVLSVGVPSKYQSKKNMLLISTSAQESCTGAIVEGLVTVGSFNTEPAPNGFMYNECDDNAGFEMRARNWFLLPESAGGPVVPDGATVDYKMCAFPGGAAVGRVAMHVELQK